MSWSLEFTAGNVAAAKQRIEQEAQKNTHFPEMIRASIVASLNAMPDPGAGYVVYVKTNGSICHPTPTYSYAHGNHAMEVRFIPILVPVEPAVAVDETAQAA
jgi:hypothetical protein